MSEKVKKFDCSVGPFGVRIDAPSQKDFDKFYYEVETKDVFKEIGIDVDGDRTGVIEQKIIVKKVDIAELINSQVNSVGVESYMKSLMIQGVDITEMNTAVDDRINDFSQCPDNLADSVLIGDEARKAFANLDPSLKGDHTTIEGFLNSLTRESVDSYIHGRIEALMPKKSSAVDGGE